MDLEKKDIAIIILSFSLLLSSIGNILLSVDLGFPIVVSPERETLLVGTSSGPADLDPVDAWDSASTDVIRQVCETLFFNNLSDPDLPRVNWLCESYNWDDDVTLRINIRTGIKFHDGTVMDATACAWNFDRLLYHMNHTGELFSGGHRAKIHSLYEFPDSSPIMNRTEVIDTDTFRIHLNEPYTQLLALMTYISCSILSPSSTSFDHYLDKNTDDLVGTGPYMYDYYFYDDEVHFTRFDEYWGGPASQGLAYFEVMIYNIIDDPTTRNYAMLARDIDYILGSLTDISEDFKATHHITFYEHQNPSLTISYLSMNNDILTIAEGDKDDADVGINKTWRKAISFAINYTYIIEELYDNQVVRAYSPISPGFGPYYDQDIEKVAPYCNYTIARQTIIDDLGPVNSVVGGLPNTQPGTITAQRGDDATWENVTLVSFNFTYFCRAYWGSGWYCDPYAKDIFNLLLDWLEKIGINIIEDYLYYYGSYGYSPEMYDQTQIRWLGWNTDYHDPMNMIQPLVSSLSQINYAQVNDPLLDGMILTYNTDIILSEIEKIELIQNITRYLVTELYPHVYGFHYKIFSVHASDLYNVPYNSLDHFWAYPITRYNYSQWQI